MSEVKYEEKTTKDKVQSLIINADYILENIKDLSVVSDHFKRQNYRNNSSPELVNAVENVMIGKAYLGQTMGQLGEKTPYQNDGKRETAKDIEPTANKVADPINPEFRAYDTVKKIDLLRGELQLILNKIMDLKQDANNKWSYHANIYTTSAVIYLTNAKMWLGFELGRIRDSK